MSRTFLPLLPAALANGHMPVDGIVTAGQPRADQFATLAAAGIGTMIDIRGQEDGCSTR